MLDWLSSELAAMSNRRAAAPFALALSDKSVILKERVQGGYVTRAETSHDANDFEARMTSMRAMVAGRLGSVAPVDLLLPEELVFHRADTFPAEASADLRDAVWWRLDTMTRLKPEELCYDVALIDADAVTGFLELSVAVAQKQIVEEALGFARKWQFRPQRVSTQMAVEGFEIGPTFAQIEDISAATRSLRWAVGGLAAAALLLACVGVWRGVGERAALADAAEERRVQVEERLNEVRAVRDATIAFAQEAERPAEWRAGRPLALERLAALARSLPPSARADRIVIADGVLRIEGSAANADAVLAAVEVAPEFETARYAAAVASSTAGAVQVFAIEANIVQEQTP